MAYLAHTIHPQLVGLWLGSMGWTLTMVSIGLIQWRVWEVADMSDISSGEAWVGIWRVCFYSNTLVTAERNVLFCQKMYISQSFVPMEIGAAQVLMLVALILGLSANASTIYGLRNAFFGRAERRPIRVAFTAGGVLHLLSSLCSFLPLSLNLHAVATNQSISFPKDFHMPPAPLQQHAGPAIGVGMTAAVFSVVSGLLFLCYQFPEKTSAKVEPSGADAGHTEDRPTWRPLSSRSDLADGNSVLSPYALDNAAFQSEERV